MRVSDSIVQDLNPIMNEGISTFDGSNPSARKLFEVLRMLFKPEQARAAMLGFGDATC